MREDIKRDQLVILVKRILNRDYGSEEERDRLMLRLESAVRHPAISDLIYYSEQVRTAEEIVDEALEYKPISMPAVDE